MQIEREITISSKKLYEGKILNLRVDEVELPNGQTSTREIVGHRPAVAVLALDENKNVLMVEQYRYGADLITIEIPAGLMERGEEPLSAARRELREETGYNAKRWHYLLPLWTSPGFTDEVVHLYLATDLEYDPLDPDYDEFLNLKKISIDQAKDVAFTGNGNPDSKTVAALSILLAFQTELGI